MGTDKFPPISDPKWTDAVIADIEQSTHDEVAFETARNGKNAAPASAIMTGKMFGELLSAIHCLAKRVDEVHKAAAADAEALNQTVETFAKALAEIQENGFRYRGFWRQGMHATRGEAYTENGGLWYCLRATTDRPRNESPDWNMCARAGRDGRDAR